MNNELILKYQEKDALLFKLERELDQNENKRIAIQMVSIVKDLQNRSTMLELEAEHVVKEFEELQEKNKEIAQKASALAATDVESISDEDVEKLLMESSQFSQTLSQIEKRCVQQAERVSNILAEFEESKKKFGLARAKHKNHKELYEQAYSLSKPNIDTLKKDLWEIEKDLPATVIAKYKLVRQDKIFPVFVPLMGKYCGGCQMELSTKKIETLIQSGFIECENCRRQIFVN